MSGRKVSRSFGLSVMSFFLGAASILVLGAAKDKNMSLRELIKPGVFGNIRIDIVDANYLQAKEVLSISKGENPFIHIFKDSSGKVFAFGIADDIGGSLALAMFEGDKISQFSIFGNKVYDDEKMLVFAFAASDRPGIWHEVRYMPSSKVYKEGGQIKSYKLIGEAYEDLDFDGQFDAKSVWDENSEITSQSIFVNGKWQKLGWRSPDGEMRKVGAYDIEKLEAYTRIGKRKVYYDFEFGKGWKENREKREKREK